MPNRWPALEKDLAKPIVEWLTDLRWEVYQEVQVERLPRWILDNRVRGVRGEWAIEGQRRVLKLYPV